MIIKISYNINFYIYIYIYLHYVYILNLVSTGFNLGKLSYFTNLNFAPIWG